jgi:hypothetical protein
MHWVVGLGGYCQNDGDELIGPPYVCGDSNVGSGFPEEHEIVADDPAFGGPLTFKWEFVYLNGPPTLDPYQEYYRFGVRAWVHLDYAPIPEPSTALLVMTGLLGLAYRQRRASAWLCHAGGDSFAAARSNKAGGSRSCSGG